MVMNDRNEKEVSLTYINCMFFILAGVWAILLYEGKQRESRLNSAFVRSTAWMKSVESKVNILIKWRSLLHLSLTYLVRLLAKSQEVLSEIVYELAPCVKRNDGIFTNCMRPFHLIYTT